MKIEKVDRKPYVSELIVNLQINYTTYEQNKLFISNKVRIFVVLLEIKKKKKRTIY